MLEKIVRDGLEAMEIYSPPDAAERLRRYAGMLVETNKVMNLTAITEEDEIARLHFLDSAALLKYADTDCRRVIDVGTGAGFPGMVLKILRPGTELTLLDSLDKRIGFLKETADVLGLEGVEFVHARAEEIFPARREHYDIAVSRAVARLSVLAELCLPYVRVGGCFIAMKGPDFEEELEEAKPCIKQMGGKTESCESYTIPGTDICHSAIIIRKLSETPAKFPRRWAQIKKAPLK